MSGKLLVLVLQVPDKEANSSITPPKWININNKSKRSNDSHCKQENSHNCLLLLQTLMWPLEMGQGDWTQREGVKPDRGYQHVQFQWPHFKNLWENTNIQVLSRQWLHQIPPLIKRTLKLPIKALSSGSCLYIYLKQAYKVWTHLQKELTSQQNTTFKM